MAEELKFDAEDYASRGFYAPPLGNAAHNPDWELIHDKLRDKSGMVWLETVPAAAFLKGRIVQVADARDVHGAAWVHRVDGVDAQAVIKPGDVVILPANVFKQGMAVPSSDTEEELAKNKGLRILPASDCDYLIRQAACKAFHEKIMAEREATKKAMAETQADIAGKSLAKAGLERD